MAEYIDRANLIARIKYYVTHTPEGKGEHYAYSVILNEVLNCPAADVVPVVHGQWDGNNCTACKLPWNWNMVQNADDWGYFDPMPDYCPNCGAKMDGGADNG